MDAMNASLSLDITGTKLNALVGWMKPVPEKKTGESSCSDRGLSHL